MANKRSPVGNLIVRLCFYVCFVRKRFAYLSSLKVVILILSVFFFKCYLKIRITAFKDIQTNHAIHKVITGFLLMVNAHSFIKTMKHFSKVIQCTFFTSHEQKVYNSSEDAALL